MFRKYNSILYPFKKDNIDKVVTDISTNVRIQQELVNSLAVYNYKTLKDGETPEITAFQDYNNPKLHYLVMLANELYDWRDCYPLTQAELDSYINEKYINQNNIHHFEDVYGNISPSGDGEFCIPITNREYEENLNEAKRFIKTIKEPYVQSVVDAITQLVKNNYE